MKLNEKGLLKILNACYVDEDYDEYVLRSLNRKENLFEIQDTAFEQDDFQDVIILTLEEAKKISDALEWVDGYMYSYAYKKDIEDFNKRIEQAQSGNEV